VPLLLFLTVNLTNIALDLLFVIGFGMEVAGVALASVIAEYAGLFVGIACAVLELKRRPGHWLLAHFARLREYGAFFAVNANLFVRTMALMFTIAFVTARGARMGDVILAANAIMMNFQNLTAFALDGIAHAAEALVGRAVGARDPHAFRKSVSLCLKWSLVFASAFSLAYWLTGPALIALLTDLPAVRAAAIEYLPWMIASPLVSAWSFLYDGVFVGATRSRDMRNIMLLAAGGVFLPAWWLLQGFGNHGLWAAFLLFLAARGIGMHVIYRKTLLHRVIAIS
jgi:multidrug resistance protein, MATE family